MPVQSPESDLFSSLPKWKAPWYEFVLSYGVQAVVIAILVWIPVLHPEVLEGPKKDYHAIELVPTPVPENHEPQRQLPKPVLVALVPIEIISFLSRPVSLSVRLFANMLAGHITLAVFGGFVALLLGAGVWALLAPVPLLAITALYALELLVACLQAFVFATLTCVYLNDAIHPGH